MRIQILGGHGGESLGLATTSFLINDELLIDAGSVTSKLTVEQQCRIDHILISHSHLDHIKDLAFLCDNCFGSRPVPFKVYTHPTVEMLLKKHLFNEFIWPDFTILPSKEHPTMEFHAVEPERPFQVGRYQITAVKVQHPNDAMGFIIEAGEQAVLFTVDTGPTERIWEVARKIKNLRAIFTEVSFPNALHKVAVASDHHTPQSLKLELTKMPPHIPVVLTHLKPGLRDRIREELAALEEPRLRVLEEDGQVFEF